MLFTGSELSYHFAYEQPRMIAPLGFIALYNASRKRVLTQDEPILRLLTAYDPQLLEQWLDTPSAV